MAQTKKPREIQRWLATNPSLADLREAYPAEWTTVERELMAVVDSGDPAALTQYTHRLANPAPVQRGDRPATPGLDPATAAAVRQRMGAHAIRGLSLRAATGVEKGSVRFGKINGLIAQRLLFTDGLTRKPVSNGWFRLVWPLLSQRRRLMPLVQPQGIYCFYSRRLIRELAALIDGRPALEIAAGDGTLSRFLLSAGTQITATDDHSWSDVRFPAGVERLDAKAALRKYQPQVVLCSWPPAGNPFEAEVFKTASVQTYVVIGNRHTPGWGNHAAYAAQASFDVRDDEALGRLVLPPELESLVLVFQRQA